MSKFCGKIGYCFTKETSPGVWEEIIEEKDAVGDLIKTIIRQQSSNSINDTITLNNTISLIADPYASQNYGHIKFIKFGKEKIAWKVDNAELQYPRLILTLGGVYNG